MLRKPQVVSLDRDVQIFLSVVGQSIPVDIPIDLVGEVPINTEVPIDAQIPVQMAFPVRVPREEMGLNALLADLQEAFQLLGGDG